MPKNAKPTQYEISDDFDGKTLDDATKAFIVSLNGNTYELYLSEENKKQVTDVLDKIESKGSKLKARTSSVDRHGFELNEVREWAVKTKKKTKAGKPIKSETKILHQGIWDAYRDAQSK